MKILYFIVLEAAGVFFLPDGWNVHFVMNPVPDDGEESMDGPG